MHFGSNEVYITNKLYFTNIFYFDRRSKNVKTSKSGNTFCDT